MSEVSNTLRIGEILRYSTDADTLHARNVDGLVNWYVLTAPPPGTTWTKVKLDAGINASRVISGSKHQFPFVAVRSSPHRFGTTQTPWEDLHRPDQGYSRYFGDAKSGAVIETITLGNRRMLEAFRLQSGDREDRLQAPPILVFESVTIDGRKKGQVLFHGVALIVKAQLVVQRDPQGRSTFPNYLFELLHIDLSTEGERLDWAWINQRRHPDVAPSESLHYAPEMWRRWVANGPKSLAGIRRNVITRAVVGESMQRPLKGSEEENTLRQIYGYFSNRVVGRIKFEILAEFVATQVFRTQGVSYDQGWITQSTGDGGYDFVGTVDLDAEGTLRASRQVVLGQAKCEALNRPTNGVHIARLAARLRRGWIGVFVTTSYFSLSVQREILADKYPVVLIDGLRMVNIVRADLLAQDLELNQFLESLLADYETRIGFGDPDMLLA